MKKAENKKGFTLGFPRPLRERVAVGRVRGFTLIELLVVVLIIAVLAAIAVPQYQKAVKKTRGREVLVALNTLDKALLVSALRNGSIDGYLFPAEKLDIKIPDLHHFWYEDNPNTKQFQGVFMGGTCRIVRPEENIMIESKWDIHTGARLYTTCSGDACNEYFNCNFQEEPFYPCGGPNRGCSASGTSTTCYLN